MLPAELVQFVCDHRQDVAERAVRRMRSKKRPFTLESISPALLRARTREVLQNLGTLLVSDECEIARRYEQAGRTRFEEGTPLHEEICAWQIIKASMMQYVDEREGSSMPLDTYSELELRRATDRLFDTMIRFTIRGYERAMREEPEMFGVSRKRPEAQPEFSGPLPF
jgi:hypothetical protein